MARRSPSRYPARWRSLAGGSWLGSDRSAAAGLVTGWPRQRRPRRSGHLARPRRAPAALRSRIDAVVRVAGAGCERRGGEQSESGSDAVDWHRQGSTVACTTPTFRERWCHGARATLFVCACGLALLWPGPANAELGPLGRQDILVIRMLVPPGSLPTDPVAQTVRDCYYGQVAKYTQTPRISAADLETRLTTDPNLSELYRSASYGKTRLTFTVLRNPNRADGWWPAPHTLVDYCFRLPDLFRGSGTMVHDAVTEIYQTAVYGRLVDPTFRRIAVLVSKVDTGGQGTRIPVVYLFSIGLGRSPETFTAALWNLQPNDTRLVSVLRHELGHELGLEDYYPLDDPCPPYPSAPDPWWNRACVAPWDPMGYAEFGTEFSGYSRLQLGWLDGGADWGDVLTLPALLGAAFTTRTWTLDLAPLEGTTAEIGAATTREKPRLLRIPVIPGREYDVECRRQVAFDRAWIHRSA